MDTVYIRLNKILGNDSKSKSLTLEIKYVLENIISYYNFFGLRSLFRLTEYNIYKNTQKSDLESKNLVVIQINKDDPCYGNSDEYTHYFNVNNYQFCFRDTHRKNTIDTWIKPSENFLKKFGPKVVNFKRIDEEKRIQGGPYNLTFAINCQVKGIWENNPNLPCYNDRNSDINIRDRSIKKPITFGYIGLDNFVRLGYSTEKHDYKPVRIGVFAEGIDINLSLVKSVNILLGEEIIKEVPVGDIYQNISTIEDTIKKNIRILKSPRTENKPIKVSKIIIKKPKEYEESLFIYLINSNKYQTIEPVIFYKKSSREKLIIIENSHSIVKEYLKYKSKDVFNKAIKKYKNTKCSFPDLSLAFLRRFNQNYLIYLKEHIVKSETDFCKLTPLKELTNIIWSKTLNYFFYEDIATDERISEIFKNYLCLRLAKKICESNYVYNPKINIEPNLSSLATDDLVYLRYNIKDIGVKLPVIEIDGDEYILGNIYIQNKEIWRNIYKKDKSIFGRISGKIDRNSLEGKKNIEILVP